MTTDTTDTTDTSEGAEVSDPVDAGAAAPAGDGPSGAGPADTPSEAGSAERPYLQRYLVPLLLPLAVLAAIVFFVLNLSRLYLAASGTGAVVIAVFVTVLILAGGATLSAAPRMRSGTVGMLTAVVLLVVLAAGWLAVGSAEEKAEEGIVLGPAVGALEFASGNLYFDPKAADAPLDPAAAPTVIQVTLTNEQAGTHTFVFEDPAVVWSKLQVDAQGDSVSGKAGFPAEGAFVFYCDIPGHRAGGMEGTISVTSSLEPTPVEETATTVAA